MGLKPLAFYPGSPAAYCLTHDDTLDLQGLVATVLPTQRHLVWLDSARMHRLTGRYSLVGWDPWLILSAVGDHVTLTTSTSSRQTRGNPLDALRQILARYPGPRQQPLPALGLGFFGVFGYELNRWIERLPAPKPIDGVVPELLVCGMKMVVVVDHFQHHSICMSVADPALPSGRAKREARERLEAFAEALNRVAPSATGFSRSRGGEPVTIDPALLDGWSGKTPNQKGGVEPTMSQGQFEAMVRAAQEYIKAGDIFQANLAQRFHAAWSGSAWPLYVALRRVNPSPFACFVRCPEFSVVSCSPERLVQVRDGVASARPIAGTRPRGISAEEDLVNSLELILSDKERAEHIMLVDLARNDLGRVCQFGSVQVDELMTLEDYSHVIHIVSNVRGTVKPAVDAVDVVRALFPGGTITGCPKVRAMEVIQELEPVGRGLYTGSCGSLGFDGSLDFNILIRTIVVHRHHLSFHVGAGIVADSQPDREYHETLAKAEALITALQATRQTQSANAIAR